MTCISTVSYTHLDGQLLSKERFQCKFTPPPGARNFNVTVIGGGSGGRDGTSDYKELLNVTYPTSGSFTAKEENEYYNIILISGGGGGGGSPRDWNNGSAGYGGGGGAGGVKMCIRDRAYLLQSKAKWYVLRIKNPATRSFGVCARYLNHAIKHTDTTAVSSVSPAFLYIFLYNIQPKITASQIKKNIIPSFFVHAPSAAKISERRMLSLIHISNTTIL